MRRAATFAALLVISATLVGGGSAGAHSPRFEIRGAEVTDFEKGGPDEMIFFIKITVKNQADHTRDVRCTYFVDGVAGGTSEVLARGTEHRVIQARGTRSMRARVVGIDPGLGVEFVLDPHCHAR